MKGVTNIEFLVAVFVFLTTISFISFSIITNLPLLHGRASSEDIKSVAFRLSEQLAFNKGLTDDGKSSQWTAVNFSRIGFAGAKKYEISENKINELKQLCNTTTGYKKAIDFVGGNVDIDIRTNFGIEDKICVFAIESQSRNQFTVQRSVVKNGIEGTLLVKIIG